MTKSFVIKSFTSCLGLGFLPKAPGTWASAAAGVFWTLLGREIPMQWYLILVILLLVLGAVASHFQSEGDVGSIVIDEWVGMGITLLVSQFTWLEAGIGFLLFRVFDIWKLWGVKYFDTREWKGFGVMLDDALAGIYSAILLFIIISGLTWYGII